MVDAKTAPLRRSGEPFHTVSLRRCRHRLQIARYPAAGALNAVRGAQRLSRPQPGTATRRRHRGAARFRRPIGSGSGGGVVAFGRTDRVRRFVRGADKDVHERSPQPRRRGR
jgi:hypothetical protein